QELHEDRHRYFVHRDGHGILVLLAMENRRAAYISGNLIVTLRREGREPRRVATHSDSRPSFEAPPSAGHLRMTFIDRYYPPGWCARTLISKAPIWSQWPRSTSPGLTALTPCGVPV